jgi:hypothetical protein
MKKIIVIGIVSFLLFSGLTYTLNNVVTGEPLNEEININFEFENIQIENVNIHQTEFNRVTIEDDSMSYTSSPGNPVVPVKGCNIVIPYGHEVDSISVSKKGLVSFSADLSVEPAQRVYPYNYEGDFVFEEPNMEVYGSDDVYPSSDFEVVSTQVFRGYTILVLRLYPVKYRPLFGQIDFYKNVEVSVKTSSVSDSGVDTFRGLEKDFDEVKKRVDNPLTLDNDVFSPVSSLSPFDSYDLVIITPKSLKNYNGEYNFQALADAKAGIGLSTKIMTVEDIENGYNGSSTQQKIRNFVKYAYNNWQTDYVLLAGDEDVVPVKNVYVSDYHSTTMPSDLYYACLDNPAPDGTSSCDLTAEVYVGRACVGNTQEVSNFVKKTIGYMQTNDPYTKKALWVGEYLGFGGVSQYAAKMKDQNIGHSTADGYTTDGLPEGGDGYNVDRLYERDMSWGKNTIINKLNSNVHLINHLGHGNKNLAMKMYNSDVSRLTNDKYFFIYSQTCLAGHFDNYDCFAEEITVKTDNGAFAVVMNARSGWGLQDSTDGPSQRYDREFWDAIYGEKIPTLGQANHDSKEDNLYRIGEPCMKWCYYQTNLFGDPSIIVHGSGPQLSYEPRSYDFGKMEEGETASTIFDVWNSNSGTLSYSIIEDTDWIEVTPSSGTSTGEHDEITINIDTTGLSNGLHKCDILIETNSGSGVFSISVKVGQVLAFKPHSYKNNLNEGEIDKFDFEIWNDGIGELVYSLSTENDWISFTPSEGSITGEHDSITTTIDTNGLENGFHKGQIKINSNGGNNVLDIDMGVGAYLALSDTDHNFGILNTGETARTEFEIWNQLKGTQLDYEITTDVDWLSVFPPSGSSTGEHDKITINIDTQYLSDGCGYYHSPITISSNGGQAIFNVYVDIVFSKGPTYGDSMFNTKGSINGDYDEAWNCTEGIVDGKTNMGIPVGQEIDFELYPKVKNFKIYRGFLFFDTSDLTDDMEINEAILMIEGNTRTIQDDFHLVLQNGQPEYPHNPLEDGDFNRLHYSGDGGSISTADINPFEYSNLVLNQEGINWVNKGGITKFALRSKKDIDGIPPDKPDSNLRTSNVVYISDILSDFTPQLVLKYGEAPNIPEIVNPTDDEENVDVDVELSVRVSDPDGNSMTVGFYDASNNRLIGVDRTVSNNDVASVVWNGLDYETSYEWYAVADDHSSETQSETWSFTTRIKNDPPVCVNEKPENCSNDIAIGIDELKVDIEDVDGDLFDWSITTSPDIGQAQGSNEGDGTKTCPVSGLLHDTTYTWTVTTTDEQSGLTTTKEYSFKTSLNNPPHPPTNPYPANSKVDVSPDVDLSWSANDPDYDELNFDVYFGLEPNLDNDDLVSEEQSSKSYDPETLELNTTYYWKIVSKDEYGLSTESNTWEFTTKKHPVELQLKTSLFNRGTIDLEILNMGKGSVSNIEWNLTVDSIIFDRIHINSTGIVQNLEDNGAVIVSTDEISGFGLIKIKIKANVSEDVFTKDKFGFIIGKSMIII